MREWPVDDEYRSIMHESSFGGSCPGSPTINIILNELWLTIQYMVQLPCQFMDGVQLDYASCWAIKCAKWES